MEGWGELSISNLRKAIKTAQSISLDKFIFSIGIRHIGQENAKILAGFFGSINEFSNLFDLKKREKLLVNLADLDGIGETQIKSISNFFINKTNIRIINDLKKNLVIKDYIIKKNKGKFSSKKLMFTGGFQNMSRSEAKLIAENNGGKVLGSISRKLDFLIVGDTNQLKRKSTKLKN